MWLQDVGVGRIFPDPRWHWNHLKPMMSLFFNKLFIVPLVDKGDIRYIMNYHDTCTPKSCLFFSQISFNFACWSELVQWCVMMGKRTPEIGKQRLELRNFFFPQPIFKVNVYRWYVLMVVWDFHHVCLFFSVGSQHKWEKLPTRNQHTEEGLHQFTLLKTRISPQRYSWRWFFFYQGGIC